MLSEIYKHIPVFMQNFACSLYGFREHARRYGGKFGVFLEKLRESEWMSSEQIEEYQSHHLNEIAEYCYQHVPYYKNVFNEKRLKPSDFTKRSDLAKLPIITKEDVREKTNQFISNQFPPKKLFHFHTSGSTGKSLDLYYDLEALQFRWAMFWRHRMRFGVDFDTPYATFTGKSAIPLGQKSPPYWRENSAMKQTVFSMHHITGDKAGAIAQRLNDGYFTYYSGYPSIIFALAQLIVEKGLYIKAHPKMIFTGAEKLLPYQQEVISNVFGAPVTDLYGFAEGCGNASSCPNGRYHEDVEHGILECNQPERLGPTRFRGEIIGSGFTMHGMPLLRYRTGDIGTWEEAPCPCGRKTRTLVEIDGRVEDYILTPEGARLMRFDYIFKDTPHIKEAQVVQRELGCVVIRIVKRSDFSTKDEGRVRSNLVEMVSPKLKVLFEYPVYIERTNNGKFRAVVNEIKEYTGKTR